MGYIIKINSESSIATNLIKYLKTFDFVTVTKEKTALASPQTKKMTAKEKEKLINDLSKSTNKAITKRMFAHFKMTYPE